MTFGITYPRQPSTHDRVAMLVGAQWSWLELAAAVLVRSKNRGFDYARRVMVGWSDAALVWLLALSPTGVP